MRITELQLNGYRRFALNNIRSFTFKPKELIQLVLGTNGSGKSSLIKELTPLPAEAADYTKDGSKTIKITNRGHTYVLKNNFGGGAKHSFEKDGDELNKGGTGAVQKELVWQEFGITPMIHELLTGDETFHNMSPSRRREWFTLLSDINYDYALSVYSKLKERSRDTSGALKLAKKRIVVESSKIISAEEERRLRGEVEQALGELNILIANSAPVDRPIAAYEQDQRACLEELTVLGTRLLKMRFIAPYGIHPTRAPVRDEWYELSKPGFTSVADIDVVVDELRHQCTRKEVLINSAVTEHTEINNTVKILLKTGEEGAKALRDRIVGIRANRDAALAKRKLSIEGIDAVNALSAFDSVYEVLTATFSAIPENEDRRFSQARLKEVQALRLTTIDSKNTHAANLAKMATKRAHLEAHKANGSMACPKCKHTWIANYSDEHYDALLQLIANSEEDLRTIEKSIQTLDAEITAIQDYGNVYQDYVRCVRNWPVLLPFWNYLSDAQYITRSPRKALSILEIFRADLELEVTAAQLDRDIAEVVGLVHAAEQVGDASLTEMRQRLDNSSLTIDALTADLTALKTNVSEYIYYKRQLTEAFDISSKITVLMASAEKATTDAVEMMRRETINHCIKQLQHSLALKQQSLSAALLQKGIIADLEDQIATLTIEEEAAKVLVMQLSPTDGLIAEGMLGFIRNYTQGMNNLIRKIWTYPLQILDCGIANADGAELDYKFPMLVGSKTNVVRDVKEGSSGMREIINLAFKVVAVRYLGLAESPLYLDEFSASLDKEHRTAATAAIKSLMDAQPFTQLFMVDHYSSSYGAFTNAEVCVLDARNVAVPTIYNQHVTITN